jgi:hypothetical protein
MCKKNSIMLQQRSSVMLFCFKFYTLDNRGALFGTVVLLPLVQQNHRPAFHRLNKKYDLKPLVSDLYTADPCAHVFLMDLKPVIGCTNHHSIVSNNGQWYLFFTTALYLVKHISEI